MLHEKRAEDDHRREADQVKNRRVQARLTLAADAAAEGSGDAEGAAAPTQEYETGLRSPNNRQSGPECSSGNRLRE